jgi:tetratricopeptide (TPR) repeat protein
MNFFRIGLGVLVISGLLAPAFAQPANPDLPLPNSNGSGRPSFIPRSQPKLTRTLPLDSDAAQPRTMKTVVELPVPEPVAEPPLAAQPQPGPADGSGHPKVVFGEDQTSQSPAVAAKSAAQAPESTPAKPAENSPGTDQGKPTVIFGEEAEPTPTPAATPTPTPNPIEVAPPTPSPSPPEQPPDPQILLKQRRFSEVEPIALANQDAELARALGWGYYNLHSYARANKWFGLAIAWNEDDYEAAYGMALALTRQGDYDKAEQVARWRLGQYPSMGKVLGDILVARAVAAYKQKEYRQSLQLYSEVETYRALSRDEKILQAWDYFQTGSYAIAAQQFEELYVAKPDKFSASGVYAAYARLKNWNRLAELAQTYGGPLAELYRGYLAERYYNHRLYANAYATDPQKYPNLSAYTSPAAALSGFARFKSGSEGTSQLTEYRGDAEGIFYQDDINRFSLDAGYLSLSAGSLSNGAFVGQVPLVGPRLFAFSPKTTYSSLFDFRVGYQHLGFYTPSVEIGMSPVGGALDPTLVGKIALTGLEDWGSWNASIYRNSVKQSLLSYTGFKDPYSGTTWGRVSEDGLMLSAYDNLEGGWGIYGQFGGNILEGVNVETNNHVTLGLSINRQFENPNFSYFSVGPSFTFDHYAQNQDFFTFGQGGYFSPDYLYQGAVALRFMTKENRPYLIKGDLLAGLQSYQEDSAPIFPLQNSPGTFSGTYTQTFNVTARLAGLVLVAPQWSLGTSLEYNKTGNYSEFTAAAFMRFFFEPRIGLFGTDF